MRLLLNYKGINKILPKVGKYADIVQFINQTFFLKMSKWNLVYIDADGDTISLDSDLDIQTMLETATKDHIKVYIRDCVEDNTQSNSQQIQQHSNTQKQSKKQDQVPSQKQCVEEEKKQQLQKIQNPQEPPKSQNEVQHCRWRKQWKKKMQEKMASFVDERIETLIPCLAQKIESYMKNQSAPKSNIVEGVKHDVKCTGCGVQPIPIIRYKCTICANFNFCIQCQEKIVHPHNMIKMKYVEEAPKQEQIVNAPWGRWKHEHKKNQDDMLKVTRKSFKMAEAFGGVAEDYKKFVENNKDLKFKELSQFYLKNNDNAAISQQVGKKAEKMCEKISFYFSQPKQNFEDIVNKNPCANLKDLISTIKEIRKQPIQKQQAIEDKKQVQSEVKNSQISIKEPQIIKEEQKIIQEKSTEQKEQVKQPIQEKPKQENKKQQKKGWFNWALGRNTDVKKRNDCLLLMKEYFGEQNTFQYIKFYDEFSNLANEDIIAKYIEKIAK